MFNSPGFHIPYFDPCWGCPSASIHAFSAVVAPFYLKGSKPLPINVNHYFPPLPFCQIQALPPGSPCVPLFSWCCCPCIFVAILAPAYSKPLFTTSSYCCCPCIFDTPSKLCLLWAPVSQSRHSAFAPVYLTHHPSSAYYEPLFLLLPLYIWSDPSHCLQWAEVSEFSSVSQDQESGSHAVMQQ